MRWAKQLGLAVLAEVALFVAAVIFILFYSSGIHPNETPAFYGAAARQMVPWVAVVVSFPLFYWMSRWAGPWPLPLAFWIMHEVIDVAISLATDGLKGLAAIAPLWLASQGAKLLGCWLGSRGNLKN